MNEGKEGVMMMMVLTMRATVILGGANSRWGGPRGGVCSAPSRNWIMCLERGQ